MVIHAVSAAVPVIEELVHIIENWKDMPVEDLSELSINVRDRIFMIKDSAYPRPK